MADEWVEACATSDIEDAFARELAAVAAMLQPGGSQGFSTIGGVQPDGIGVSR